MQLCGRRMVEIRGGLEVTAEHFERGVERNGARCVLGKHRCRPDAEVGDASARSIRDAGKADDGVVAVAPGELEEYRALDLWKFGGGDDLARANVGLEKTLEKFTRRHAPLAAAM